MTLEEKIQEEREEASREARREARIETQKEERIKFAKKMLSKNTDVQFIVDCTGMSVAEVEALKKSLEDSEQ